MAVAAVEMLDCGIDYITVTATDPPKSKTLRDIGYELIEKEAEAGNPVKKWRGLGYAGLFCGSASVGVGEQGVLVRLSSGLARDEWKEPFFYSMNCTRLDVQVTLREQRSADEVLREQWAAIGLKRNTMVRPPKAKEVSSHSRMETIMLGVRQSDRYGRIYDKGLESGLPELDRAVRFELETKNAVAKNLARYLAQSKDLSADVGREISRFLQKRGGRLPIAVSSAEGAPCPRSAPRRLEKLAWLQRCVKPIISDYVRRGRLQEVLEALELSEVVLSDLNSRRLVQPDVDQNWRSYEYRESDN